jgi:UTP--glucose-1-phosphate uridylyltransferase
MAVRKAVIPAAGLGTRLLPATKAIPKEMLPVVDKPIVQYVVEEAVSAGLNEIIIVVGDDKQSIVDHFGPATRLEEILATRDKTDLLEQVRAVRLRADIGYVRQPEPRGLGDAVLRTRQQVAGEPFAILLGDVLVDFRDPLLARMIDVQRRYGGTVLSLLEVPPERVTSHGCAAYTPTAEEDVVAITDLIEKPSIEAAPSRWIVVGRYVCHPAVFDVLERIRPDRSGEVQLTDALKVLAGRAGPDDGGPVHGVLFRGRRYDMGNKLAYAKAWIELAVGRADLAGDLVPWLHDFVTTRLPGDARRQP